MARRKWSAIVCPAALLSIAAAIAWGAPQAQPNPPYTSAEFSAYQSARKEQHLPKRFALLDAFVAEHPDSVLVTAAYHEYAGTYLIVGDSRKSIEYIDKFLARLGKVDQATLPEGMFGSAQRLDGLYIRARAYLEGGCSDTSFQTPDAYRRARDTATEGLRLLGDWDQKPPTMRDYEFAFLKKQAVLDSVPWFVSLSLASKVRTPRISVRHQARTSIKSSMTSKQRTARAHEFDESILCRRSVRFIGGATPALPCRNSR